VGTAAAPRRALVLLSPAQMPAAAALIVEKEKKRGLAEVFMAGLQV